VTPEAELAIASDTDLYELLLVCTRSRLAAPIASESIAQQEDDFDNIEQVLLTTHPTVHLDSFKSKYELCVECHIL
jgi:hypothetical protein